MVKFTLPLVAAFVLSACVGGGSRSDEVSEPVIQAPVVEEYTLIGGPVGDALVEGRDPLREAQSLLSDLGYDPGPADGLMGPRTRAALEQFQSSEGVPVSGTLTVDTQGALQFEKNVGSQANDVVANSATPAAAVATAPPPTSTRQTTTTSGSNTWLAFISGEDIRAQCSTGTQDNYRFIYNAEYTEHVRLYEMVDTGDGSAVLDIIVRGPTRISGDPSRISGRINGKRSLNGLAPFERNSLVQTLMSSGFTASPLPAGTVLPSDGHFWVVSGCRNGSFTLNAWTYPSDRWDSITFPGMLGQLDFTNVQFNPLSQLTEAQRAAARSGDGQLQAFDIRVGSDGKLQIN